MSTKITSKHLEKLGFTLVKGKKAKHSIPFQERKKSENKVIQSKFIKKLGQQ